MNIAELQTLILYAITTGVFVGFIVGAMVRLFGR